MKQLSISKLGEKFGLSRSTLLYYDRIRLLPPSGRTGSAYRYYTERDVRRLERICQFRQAGLPLKDIREVLNTGGKPGARMLEKQLRETSETVLSLRNKQRVLAGMLRKVNKIGAPTPVNKTLWVEMLRAAGMDDEAMARWHQEFEQRSPEGHEEFLISLGISRQETARIRAWARQLQSKEV
jgi:DNA-binding transcriptional MerR regulator